MPPSGGITPLVQAKANQFNRFKLAFTTLYFHRFAATKLARIEAITVYSHDFAGTASAINHHTAASGNRITVTIISHHGGFSFYHPQNMPGHKASPSRTPYENAFAKMIFCF